MKHVYIKLGEKKGGGVLLNRYDDPQGTVPLIFNLMMTKNIKQK